MSATLILIIAIAVLIVLALILLVSTSGRRDRQSALGVMSRETRRADRSMESTGGPDATAEVPAVTGKAVERAAVLERTGGSGVAVITRASPPATTGPIDPETYGQTRRQFLNRGVVALMIASLGAFGAACLGFLWPAVSAGFGGKINAGTVSDIQKTLATKTPFYNPVGRFYINPYPTDAGTLAKAKKVYSPALLPAMQAGYVILYQRCVHLGCRVPWCQSSQWFECPCHGSKYSRVGEQRHGPAPRGLDRFAGSISGGSITVDTGTIFVGPPIGTNTTGQGQDGPHCS